MIPSSLNMRGLFNQSRNWKLNLPDPSKGLRDRSHTCPHGGRRSCKSFATFWEALQAFKLVLTIRALSWHLSRTRESIWRLMCIVRCARDKTQEGMGGCNTQEMVGELLHTDSQPSIHYIKRLCTHYGRQSDRLSLRKGAFTPTTSLLKATVPLRKES